MEMMSVPSTGERMSVPTGEDGVDATSSRRKKKKMTTTITQDLRIRFNQEFSIEESRADKSQVVVSPLSHSCSQ